MRKQYKTLLSLLTVATIRKEFSSTREKIYLSYTKPYHALLVSVLCSPNYFSYNLLGCKVRALSDQPWCFAISNTPIHIKVQCLHHQPPSTVRH